MKLEKPNYLTMDVKFVDARVNSLLLKGVIHKIKNTQLILQIIMSQKLEDNKEKEDQDLAANKKILNESIEEAVQIHMKEQDKEEDLVLDHLKLLILTR